MGNVIWIRSMMDSQQFKYFAPKQFQYRTHTLAHNINLKVLVEGSHLTSPLELAEARK